MQPVSFHKEEEEIPDSKNDDSFAAETEDSSKGKEESSETIDTYNDLPVTNCDIIVSRTLQQLRNKYLDELSHQELADFLFYSEYKDVSRLPIDEDNPTVIAENEELRHTLESSVLLEIINQANPDIHLREEEKAGNLIRFWFNLLPFNYISWLIDERKKKEKIDSIIAEKEIDLEKAKDNPHYDTMKAEWLKDKEKMTYRDSSFFVDKCRQSMSSWEKMFPNNGIRHADLIFVPSDLGNHFTVLVFNVQKSMIEDIANRSDNKSLQDMCRVLQSFLQGNRIKCHGFDGLHHWKRRTIPFSWRSNQNDFDCGIYSVKAMEWYDGGNEKKDPITALSTNLARCQLAIDLVSYKENRRKQEVLKDCAVWSTTKPFLIQRQKKRKDKEKHLTNLRAKRAEKVFLEDEKIGEERARHEQEVDDFLNNDLDDSP
ncbi:Sentrin-specific protease, partial [Bienertia sinuspersici]